MPETKDWGKWCNVCAEPVPEASHNRHNSILDAIVAVDAPGWDNMFVHCQGPEEEFDMDGMVVICDACFVLELSTCLKDPAEVFHGIE